MYSMIKKSVNILLLIFFFSSVSFAQEHTDFVKSKFKIGGKLSVNDFFAKQIIYPIQALQNNDTGKVVIDFRINKKGLIDSVALVSHFNKEVADQAMNALLKNRRMWTPTLINGKPENFVYKMVVSCDISKSEHPKRSHAGYVCKRSEKFKNKGKYKKALKILNKEIPKEMFNISLLKARATVYKAMNEQEKAQADFQQIEKIKKEVLLNVKITGSMRVTKTIIRGPVRVEGARRY